MRFSEFSEDFGTGFYPDREENTSTESIIFKCASVVEPQSRDTSAETVSFSGCSLSASVLKVIAVCTGCDDHVKPLPPGFSM